MAKETATPAPAGTKAEKKPEKKAAPAASEATDQLLSSMKKRKRM